MNLNTIWLILKNHVEDLKMRNILQVWRTYGKTDGTDHVGPNSTAISSTYIVCPNCDYFLNRQAMLFVEVAFSYKSKETFYF